MSDPDESAALAWLCTNLPHLRTRAEREGWLSRLDAMAQGVRDGGSAARALRRLGWGGEDLSARTHWPNREMSSLGRLGIDSDPVVGEFQCPEHSCNRRGAVGSDASEPYCTLHETAMSFRATKSG